MVATLDPVPCTLEPYDCVTTNLIDRIDLDSGQVIYQRKCKFKTIKKTVTIAAKLAGDLPAWADKTDHPVLARIVKAGPDWVLERVSVPDQRFFDGVVVY